MYWNLFVRPKFRTTNLVDVCVTAFEVQEEKLARALFLKRHIGMDIIMTSSHPTRELAYKQIYMMGSAVKSHFEFHESSMMCSQCGLNSIGSMSSEPICDFCHMESEYEKKSGKSWNGK